jgi:hypothetical protein
MWITFVSLIVGSSDDQILTDASSPVVPWR